LCELFYSYFSHSFSCVLDTTGKLPEGTT